MGKFRQLLTIYLAMGIFAVCSLAQSSLTQIRDTITNSDGSAFNGTLVVTWVSPSTSSSTVTPLSTSARIYNGALSILLVPTTTATSGTYYQVVYYSNSATVTWTETWVVPPSTAALTVSAVRTNSTGTTGTSSGSGSTGTTVTSGGQYATLPLSISEVTGLTADLNNLNTSVGTLQTQVSGLNLTGITSTLNGLSTSVSSNSTNIQSLTTTLNNLSASSVSNNSSISTLTTSVTNLSNTVSSLSSTVSSMQSGGTKTTINTNFIDDETPSGTVNGTNASFTLSQTPVPAVSLELYRNGLAQTSGIDFTISGGNITFAAGNIPVAGDNLLAYYRTNGSTTLPNFSDDEIPTGTIDGNNTIFTLAYSPSPIISLKLYKNGMLVIQGSDYTISGSTITFISTATPHPGDSLIAYYRH